MFHPIHRIIGIENSRASKDFRDHQTQSLHFSDDKLGLKEAM